MSIAEAKKRFLAEHLRKGEKYAGLVLGKDDKPDYHLILLPGQAEDIPWERAKAWATKQGGELPTRREQALLFANLPEAFDKLAYWSNQPWELGGACAWYQVFSNGAQSYLRKLLKLRARAVRRLILE